MSARAMDASALNEEPSHVDDSEINALDNLDQTSESGKDGQLELETVLQSPSNRKLLTTPLRPEDQGALVAGRDVHQLYYVYLTSTREDWQYILESKGLGAHCHSFEANEPLTGGYYRGLEFPEAILKIERTPSGNEMFDHVAIDEIEPQVFELEGIPSHLTLEEFTEELRRAVPDWVRFRSFVPAPRQDIALTPQLAMVADLLSASALPSSAEGLLHAMAASSSQTAVYASVEGGHVSNAAARSVWRRDGSIARVLPNKLSFRVLDVYNGPVLVSCLEERSGYVVVVSEDNKERLAGAATGQQSDFVTGRLFDTYSRQAVLHAVAASISYSNLLKRLLHAGFDLGPSLGDNSRAKTRGKARCWRIVQGPIVVGAMWDRGGLFGCLRWQPSASDFQQEWGTVCVYRDDGSQVYADCWAAYQRCASTAEFRAELSRAGYLTLPVPYSAHSIH